jgi:hypothetical protein
MTGLLFEGETVLIGHIYPEFFNFRAQPERGVCQCPHYPDVAKYIGMYIVGEG